MIEKTPKYAFHGPKYQCNTQKGVLKAWLEKTLFYHDRELKKPLEEWIDKAADFMDNLLDGPKETEAAMLPQIQTPLFV